MSKCQDLQNKYDSAMKQQELLLRQNNAQNKINSLLEQSAESLMCGPTCQKIKVSEELKQKYLDAKTNMQTAPIKLEESKKNYYVFTKGEPYYDNMMEEELKKKADKLAELLSESFNEEVANAKTMNSYYNSTLINSHYTKELLSDYLGKNQALKLQLKSNHGDILTNDRKTYYETNALNNLQLWYKFWWYIYYILCLVIVISVLMSPGYKIKELLIKLIKIVFFIFLPYILHWCLGLVYTIYKKIKDSIPISIYNNL